ncbi:hypothetical protein N6H14_04570 [Paenibacillus sp. CC-CFT747]|nr:hypothetical protein N6H14_04570 [Paenibacillus sp. CC-CFT747]
MFTDTLHKLIDQYGYLLFYLTLALGPFGLPVPNEVTAMTGGVTAAAGTLNPWGVFVFIFGGCSPRCRSASRRGITSEAR